MRQAQALGGIVIGGAVVLLASQPTWAAATQVTGVRLDKSENELKLVLKTESGDERPAVFTSSKGNDAVTDIVNTQLNLSEGKTFRQENPMPGITSVLVSQLDGNSVRVTVSGENSPPTGQILQQDNQGISLSFSTAAGNQTASPIPGAQAATPILPTPLATAPSAQTSSAPTTAPTTQSQAPSTQVLPNLAATPVAQAAISQRQPSQTAGSPTTTVAQNQAPPTIVPAPPAVVPAPNQPDVLVPNPRITIQGAPAQPAGAAQPVAPAPPFLPRAVAPPVGDIAISNLDGSASTIDLGTGVRVPRLVLREAPVREVLALLARAAGLNLAYIGETPGGQGNQGGGQAGGQAGAQQTVSLDLENEPVQDAFNYVLRISGFQANRVGRTIFVGPQLPDPARNIIVRTLRLNQVAAQPAASFLISQGAEQQQITEQTTLTVVGEGAAAQRIENTTTTVEQITPQIENQGGQGGLPGPQAPLLLRGLAVNPDDRLNIVTLIGEPRLVEIATALLTQLDLRRRQVAVNVKVVDVNLDAIDNLDTSFSFGIGDSSFGVGNGSLSVNINGAGAATDRFIAGLEAQIVSRNAKILTDPTIVIQEGETAIVNLSTEVLKNIEITREGTGEDQTSTVTAEFDNAGLVLEVNVNKIDDNGFVSLVVNPRVTSVGTPIELAVEEGIVNTVQPLNVRELSSGQVRLRDGQTLILSGIIQETDQTTVNKVPILGDIPILGALFRSTSRQNIRQEVIVLVTPQILDDSEASSFGYNYTPGRETREVLDNRGFSPQRQ
ncbi:MAG: AMIN domain-containing protein [Microcoleus sp. SIO2G3]|nr:AMIN domain-containing protein [Microcoleus sp. SIO2G3]